jgi:environmental stress-induced protein Ves
MTVAVLTADQFKTQPWKNGRGVTHEVMIEPPEATVESGFIWRLSIADVTVDAPFSEFQGCDRTMVVYHGMGMILEFPMGRREQVEPFGVFRFPGEVPCTGKLIDGPVSDLNAMTLRLKARHAARIIDVDVMPRAILATTLKAQAPVVAVLAVERAVRVRVEGRDHALDPGSALITRGVLALTLASTAPTKVILVEFAQR